MPISCPVLCYAACPFKVFYGAFDVEFEAGFIALFWYVELVQLQQWEDSMVSTSSYLPALAGAFSIIMERIEGQSMHLDSANWNLAYEHLQECLDVKCGQQIQM